MAEFSSRIPDLARGLVRVIEEQRVGNPAFVDDAAGTPTLMRVRQSLAAADVQEPDLAATLVRMARDRVSLHAREAELRGRLAATGLPLLTLPAIPDADELSGVYALAEILREEWR